MNIPDTAIIVSHVYTTVPFDDLFRYLRKKQIFRILKISHPLYYEGATQSVCELYENNILIYSKTIKRLIFLPLFIQYLFDCCLTFYWVIKSGNNWDVCIALDNLNTLSAIILKKCSCIKNVVYYTIDFTPRRFANRFINNLYHFLDRLAVQEADTTWNVSDQIKLGRKLHKGMNEKEFDRQITVPIGVWLEDIKKMKTNRKDFSLVYAGGLSPHQGLDLIIKSLPELKKIYPQITLSIIGKGSQEGELKELAKELKVEESIHWLGYFPSHKTVLTELQKYKIALALYNPHLSLWSQYADPSKIKSYLACGLPVITTSVTYMGLILKNNNCGKLVKYQKEDVIDNIGQLFKDQKMYKEYSKNALEFIKFYDWETIFDKALKES